MIRRFPHGLRASKLVLPLTALWLAAAVPDARAADDFYKGKQIRLLIGTDAGGAYDMYARALSRHMGKHIPGNPVFFVQNMPGAAGGDIDSPMTGDELAKFVAEENRTPPAVVQSVNKALEKFAEKNR